MIEEGAYADVLVVDGNPLKDLKILEDHENSLFLIVKNGIIFKNKLQNLILRFIR